MDSNEAAVVKAALVVALSVYDGNDLEADGGGGGEHGQGAADNDKEGAKHDHWPEAVKPTGSRWQGLCVRGGVALLLAKADGRDRCVE